MSSNAHLANLSVHKNTLESRRAKEQRKDVLGTVGSIMRKDIRAYAFIAIDAEGEAHCVWDTGSIAPIWAFSPMIAEVLKTNVLGSDVEETWKPNLNERSRADGPPQ